MNKECFKNISCEVKVAYILIVILFCLNVYTLIASCSGKDGLSNKKIADWVSENPLAILESVQNYAQKQQEEAYKQQQEASAENIKKYSKELASTDNAGVVNPKAKLKIVEFFDYNCGYCKVAAQNINELLKKRKDVQIILRPITIMGPASVYATEVGNAILLIDSDKYVKYYNVLMGGSARSKQDVEKAVKSAGLSMSKVNKVLKKDAEKISAMIQANMDLSSKIGINGTPAFIINETLIPGAVDANTLESMLNNTSNTQE